MYIAFSVCLCMFRTKKIHFVISLCTCRTNLQHGTHCGISVNVGIVTFDITDAGIKLSDLVDGLHQYGIGFAGTGAVSAVKNVSLGSSIETVVHQLTLYCILYKFNIR